MSSDEEWDGVVAQGSGDIEAEIQREYTIAGLIDAIGSLPPRHPNKSKLEAELMEVLSGNSARVDNTATQLFTGSSPAHSGSEKRVVKRVKKAFSQVGVRKRKRDLAFDDTDDEYFKDRVDDIPNDALGTEDIEIEQKLVLPATIYDKLMEHQKQGLRWLWRLHEADTGGILADEMGLGKTVQLVTFLGALHYGGHELNPVLVVCPASVLVQWMEEIRVWYPWARVLLMHQQAGNHSLNARDLLDIAFSSNREELVIVLATYAAVRNNSVILTRRPWSYVILDEGHKIRNPDAAITLVCKEFRTLHRIILSGSPIQNRLKELWSLFDFVFQGKLGTLPVFEEEFCEPITTGGYIQASPQQVEAGYQCACLLRDMIAPHILRRMKSQIMHELPGKKEQLLFCNLSDIQIEMYRTYLNSREVEFMLSLPGKNNLAFRTITNLRKLCNDPNLFLESAAGDRSLLDNAEKFESQLELLKPWEASGKLKVLRQVLHTWSEQGHRVLLFSQTRQTLNILEAYVKSQGYSYRRMDGTTPVSNRSRIIENFNNDNSILVFLLTTRTGGLGINLTGANRVIIYDPDWNPSTDEQSLERVYRIGQLKKVVVYRLVTRGTIEEKVYHRQVFKKFLSNKVLNDPAQKNYFSSEDMRDLFTLNVATDDTLQTSGIFEDMGAEHSIGDKYETKDEDSDEEGEGKLLKLLFDNADLQTAFSHDKIMASDSKDTMLVKKRALKVAEKALDALKKSQKNLKSLPVGVLSWTGRNGTSGTRQFGSGIKKPISSAQLLGAIKLRQEMGSSQSIDEELGAYNRTLSGLQSFIRKCSSGVDSKTLAQHFADELNSTEGRAAFRKMLREIAVIKNGLWTLKPDFI